MEKFIDLMLLRKSRSDDVKEPIEVTLARHEEQLQELAIKKTGKRILEENIYREVVSGGENIKDRPTFMQVLRRLEKEKHIRSVYCMDPERLSRSGIYGAGEVLKIFDITNTLITTFEKTYNLKDPMDKKYLEMRMIQSAEYRNYSKDVMNRGRIKSVRDGYFVGSTAPYGYKRKQLPDEKNRFILEPHEEQAPVVKLMFQMIIDGVGTTELCHHLNKYKYKPKKNKHWTPAMVRNILTSIVYIGYNTWGRYKLVETIVNGEIVKVRQKSDDFEVFKGRQELLVSEEDFYKVQEILKSHPSSREQHGKSISNPLAGIIICKKCGRHMFRRPYSTRHMKNGRRKYTYDRQELLEFLRDAKSKSGLSLTQIAKKMNVTRDTVIGWFPPKIEKFYDGKNLAKHWFKLKEVLEIEDDKFDAAITTYTRNIKQKDTLICITPFCNNVSTELEIVEKRLIQALKVSLNNYIYYIDNYEEVIKQETKNNVKEIKRIDNKILELKEKLSNSRDNFNAKIYSYEEYLNDKSKYQQEISDLEEIKEDLLKETDKQDQIIKYKKAVPILSYCVNNYFKLSIEEKNKLLKDIFIQVDYEKNNNGGRWNKEVIDKFTLDLHMKLFIEENEQKKEA